MTALCGRGSLFCENRFFVLWDAVMIANCVDCMC